MSNNISNLFLFSGKQLASTDNIFETKTITGASSDEEHFRKSKKDLKLTYLDLSNVDGGIKENR